MNKNILACAAFAGVTLMAAVLPAQAAPITFTFDIATNQLVLAPIPEPGTYAMLLAGLGVLGFMARRRQS
jgi:hypothetical protein